MKKKLLAIANFCLARFGFRLVRSSLFRTMKALPTNGNAEVPNLIELLQEPLNLAILGSIGEHFSIPPNLVKKIRICSVDAVAPGVAESSENVITINGLVAGAKGPHKFIQRQSPGVSSLCEPKKDLIDRYGLTEHYKASREFTGEATTLLDIAQKNQLSFWDYIRTDLEGADFSVIAALGEGIRSTSLVEMELRFEPFYVGEPYFHEVAAYMSQKGFEVLDLRPERWRAQTKHMEYESRGRVVFCNAVFVNRELEHESRDRIIRHALVIGLMGYRNFAERILANTDRSASAYLAELEALFFHEKMEPYRPFIELNHVTHGTNDLL